MNLAALRLLLLFSGCFIISPLPFYGLLITAIKINGCFGSIVSFGGSCDRNIMAEFVAILGIVSPLIIFTIGAIPAYYQVKQVFNSQNLIFAVTFLFAVFPLIFLALLYGAFFINAFFNLSLERYAF